LREKVGIRTGNEIEVEEFPNINKKLFNRLKKFYKELEEEERDYEYE
jgi:predicted DNA-binding antitoxin AbrB/MazE fold protein